MTVAARKRAGAARAQATRERVVAAAAPLFVTRGYLDTTMAELAGGGGRRRADALPRVRQQGRGAAGGVGRRRPDPATGLGRGARAPHPTGPRRWPTTSTRRRPWSSAGTRWTPCCGPRPPTRSPPSCSPRARAAALDAHARAVDELAERPGFTVDMSLQRATDVVATLLAPETYGLLVVQQGWTTPDWAEWALRHLVADLFPGWSGVAAG